MKAPSSAHPDASSKLSMKAPSSAHPELVEGVEGVEGVEVTKEIQIVEQQQNIQQQKYEIIGQFKKTYIILEKDDGLFFVDQHAAHERILYELFSKRFEDVATVQLLFPEIIVLKENEIRLIEKNLDIFKKNGIELEVFGQNQVIIKATPVHIKDIKIDELVRQVAEWVKECQNLDKQRFFKAINERLHAQMACKAAVKAGDALTVEQMSKLLYDLEKTKNRLTCPHGRPTGWTLYMHEIEKKFKRRL
jgi:DNA mismatch repair protein MutL